MIKDISHLKGQQSYLKSIKASDYYWWTIPPMRSAMKSYPVYGLAINPTQ